MVDQLQLNRWHAIYHGKMQLSNPSQVCVLSLKEKKKGTEHAELTENNACTFYRDTLLAKCTHQMYPFPHLDIRWTSWDLGEGIIRWNDCSPRLQNIQRCSATKDPARDTDWCCSPTSSTGEKFRWEFGKAALNKQTKSIVPGDSG